MSCVELVAKNANTYSQIAFKLNFAKKLPFWPWRTSLQVISMKNTSKNEAKIVCVKKTIPVRVAGLFVVLLTLMLLVLSGTVTVESIAGSVESMSVSRSRATT